MTAAEETSIPVNYLVGVMLFVTVSQTQTTNARLGSRPSNFGAMVIKWISRQVLKPFLHLILSVTLSILLLKDAITAREGSLHKVEYFVCHDVLVGVTCQSVFCRDHGSKYSPKKYRLDNHPPGFVPQCM